MAISTCVVSGTVYTLAGAGLTDVNVKAYITTPFFHTDGTWLPNYEVSTTTASDGTWSLTLIETASISKTMTIAFDYPDGSAQRARREYTITVPATSTANFATLATGQ